MSRCTLVLIPGLMCDAAVWKPQLAPLTAIRPTRIAEHGLASDLGVMAEQILASYSGPLALVGHSMGGRVALEVARRAMGRVRGVALLDTGYKALAPPPAGKLERTARMAVVTQAKREGLRAAAAAWLAGMVLPRRLHEPALRDAILAMWERRTLAHLEAQMQALLARADATEVLKGLDVPALVLCGAEDKSAPISQHQEMHALLKQSEYVQVSECGHMCTMECPDEVAAALKAWLARIT